MLLHDQAVMITFVPMTVQVKTIEWKHFFRENYNVTISKWTYADEHWFVLL